MKSYKIKIEKLNDMKWHGMNEWMNDWNEMTIQNYDMKANDMSKCNYMQI